MQCVIYSEKMIQHTLASNEHGLGRHCFFLKLFGNRKWLKTNQL